MLKGVFKSVYRPWGNVYLVGPKPEPQPLQSPSEVPLPPLILPAVNTAGPEARR